MFACDAERHSASPTESIIAEIAEMCSTANVPPSQYLFPI